MLPSVTTYSSFIYQVCRDVGRCVKSESCPCRASSEKSMDSISVLLTILTNVSCYQTRCRQYHLPSRTQQHQCMVRATQFNDCCAKLSTSFLLSFGPNRPEQNSIDYKI